MKLLTAIGTGCLGLTVIVMISVIASSLVRVQDDEICQLFYPDSLADDAIVDASEASLYWIGPITEKHCVSRSTLHLDFKSDNTAGLGRPITVYTQEGVPVTLEVDVEYQLIASQFDETVKRTGFELTDRLMRTARSEIRNSASTFDVSDYLVGGREAIGTLIQAQLQERMDSDGVFVNIKRVNLLHIDVDDVFENLFQAVEDKRLKKLVAEEKVKIVRIDEARLNKTQSMATLATRDKVLQTAEAEVIRARLEASKQITDAETADKQAKIIAESSKVQRLIRAETTLAKTKASRELSVQSVKRVAISNRTLANTQRQNMRVQAEGNITRARAEMARDLAIAKISKTRAIQSLLSASIKQTMEIFDIELQANITGTELLMEGEASAQETLSTERAKTSDWLMLKKTLGLSDETLANLLLYRSIAETDAAKVAVDHEAVPLRLMEGDIGGVVASAPSAGSA